MAQITNLGTTNWNTGDITGNNGASFTNQGIFNILCHQRFSSNGAFTNNGTLNKAVGPGITSFVAAFNNQTLANAAAASVNVTAGEIDIQSGGTDNTPFVTGAAGAIAFNGGGANVLEQGADLMGAGTFYVSRASLQVADANTTIHCNGTLFLTIDRAIEGELAGPGKFQINGTFKWQGGTVSGLTLIVSGTTEISGTNPQNANGSTIIFQGDTTWKDSNDIVMVTSTINNSGRFEIQNDQTILPGMGDMGSQFSNQQFGTVIKTGPVGGTQTTVKVPFQQGGGLNLNGFTISFQGTLQQTGGETALNSGTLIVAATFTVTGGIVDGFGTIQGSLKLDGGTLDETMQAAVGTVTITGDFQETAAGTLKLKIGDFNGVLMNDVLNVTGTTNLGGTLTVVNMPGKSILRKNDKFVILNASAAPIGKFGTVPPPLEGGLTWLPIDYTKGVTIQISP